MSDNHCENLSVAQWYTAKNILVTGATGFMGKVLVEKLLRSCPGIDNLYVLIRPKKGQDPQQRVKKLFGCPLFNKLQERHRSAMKKVVPISGDIALPNLGLSETDKELLIEKVEIIFHSAATVKFEEALRIAVELNILGTKRMLDLGQQMKKLMAFIHVSTSYVNCQMTDLEERVYPTSTTVESILKIANIEEHIVNAVTPVLLESRPNTYTYTKAVAEQLIMENSYTFPISIVRPSIVTPSWKEPFPGWIDSLNGPTGFFLGIGKGILRTVVTNGDCKADFVPVDAVINVMICVAWKTAIEREKSPRVYNFGSGCINPIKWSEIEVIGYKYILKYPFTGMLWYPGGSFKKSETYNYICEICFHMIPAHIIDFFGSLSGSKRSMVNLHKKIKKALMALKYFSTREWNFHMSNTMGLYNELKAEDQNMFDFNLNHLDWDKYFENYILGIRRYLLKDDTSTLPRARQTLLWFYFLDLATKFVLMITAWKLIFSSNIQPTKYLKNLSFQLTMTMLSISSKLSSL